MKAPESSEFHSEGKVDGRSVSFSYKRSDGSNESVISWTESANTGKQLS